MIGTLTKHSSSDQYRSSSGCNLTKSLVSPILRMPSTDGDVSSPPMLGCFLDLNLSKRPGLTICSGMTSAFGFSSTFGFLVAIVYFPFGFVEEPYEWLSATNATPTSESLDGGSK